jgi:hypothetical protein
MIIISWSVCPGKPSLMLVGKARAYRNKALLGLLTDNILGWKGLPGTDT